MSIILPRWYRLTLLAVMVCSWRSCDFCSQLFYFLERWVAAFIYHAVHLIATCSMPGTSVRLHLFTCAANRAADTVFCQGDHCWVIVREISSWRKKKQEIRQFEQWLSLSELAVDRLTELSILRAACLGYQHSDLGHAPFGENYLSAHLLHSFRCVPNLKFLARVVLKICSIVFWKF